MKKSELRKIIKEEIRKVLRESDEEKEIEQILRKNDLNSDNVWNSFGLKTVWVQNGTIEISALPGHKREKLQAVKKVLQNTKFKNKKIHIA